MPRPSTSELIKIWDDWSAGIGYLYDSDLPGLYNSDGLLGLQHELRPAPALTDVVMGQSMVRTAPNTGFNKAMVGFAINPKGNSLFDFAEGEYTGDATTDRQIVTDFLPKMVLVTALHATNGEGMMRTDTMSGARNVITTGIASNQGISALNATGFTVDDLVVTGGRTNETGKTYRWQAFGGVNITTGSYVGTGANNVITGVVDLRAGGLVFVARRDALNSSPVRFRNLDTGFDNNSYGFDSDSNLDNEIIDLTQEEEFEVGNSDRVNKLDDTYDYVVMAKSNNFAEFSYNGNSNDSVLVPASALDFTPTFAIIKNRNLAARAVFSGFSFNDDDDLSSEFVAGVDAANLIQNLQQAAGQIEIGNDARVNTTGNAYAGMCFANSVITRLATASAEVLANTTLNISITIPPAADGFLFVFVNTELNAPSSVVWDPPTINEALTLLQTADGGTITTSLWGLATPTAGGPLNITVTVASDDLNATALFYSNCDATQPKVGTSGSGLGGRDPKFAFNEAAISDSSAHSSIFTDIPAASGSMYIASGQTTDTLAFTEGARETVIQAFTGGIESIVSETSQAAEEVLQSVYFFEENSSTPKPWLFVIRENADGTVSNLMKIGIGNELPLTGGLVENSFGAYAGELQISLLDAGQPAKYKGDWFLATAPLLSSKLVVADGDINNEIGPTTDLTGEEQGDHITNIDHQITTHLEGSGTRILADETVVVLKDPTLIADWGGYFPTGDRNERAAAMRTVEGASFVLKKDGLYAFNPLGRSALVFDDFRNWRSAMDNMGMVAWKKGLMIPHESGLLFWTFGILPINVGFDHRFGQLGGPPTAADESHGGRYHGLAVAGDFIYGLYQPSLDGDYSLSTTANVLCAFSPEGDPRNLSWHSLGTITLKQPLRMGGIHVGHLATGIKTPVLWTTNDTGVSFLPLDARASPFKAKSDTHKIVLTGDAFLSELFFPEPSDLDEIVVWTEDMVGGDEWQFSVIADNGDDIRVGPPVISNGRTTIVINRRQVNRMMLHVNWTATSTVDRIAPSLQRIELYGRFK